MCWNNDGIPEHRIHCSKAIMLLDYLNSILEEQLSGKKSMPSYRKERVLNQFLLTISSV